VAWNVCIKVEKTTPLPEQTLRLLRHRNPSAF
jgi:hypothetical protein